MSGPASALANAVEMLKFTRTARTDTYPYISPSKADGSGRAVLVTGASRGIGRATAISYAASGFSKIAITARSDLSSLEAELKKAASNAGRSQAPHILSIKVDVTCEEDVKRAAEVVTKEFGGALDVLVNNAGYLSGFNDMDETDSSDWWHHWDIHIKGTYLCSKHFLPLLLRGELKTNILVASGGGLMTSRGADAYQASKFATIRLAEFWANDYRDKDLVCFSIHPGSVATPLALNMPESFHPILVETLELSGDSIAWLGQEHRPWLSGRYVSVSWDMEELEARKEDVINDDNLLKFRMVF